MTFALTGWMLCVMWAVLGLLLLRFLVELYRSLKSGSPSPSPALDLLQNLLTYVFPLFIIVNLMPLDPTAWILLLAYYVGCIALIWKYLSDILK